MGSTAVLDKLWSPDQPANTPTSSVEILAGGADGDGEVLDLLGESCDSRKWGIVEPIVDLFLNIPISTSGQPRKSSKEKS